MAERKMFVTRKGERVYRTRMLQAGDSITLDGPTSRLHELMGYVTARRFRAPRPAPTAEAKPVEPAEMKPPAPKAPAPKRRKRTKKAK